MSAEATDQPVARVRIGVATHVTLKSSLTASESLQDFLDTVEQCIGDGELKIIVDFGAAQIIDSLGISALMDTQDTLLKKGGWLKVTGYNSIIAEVASITGLSDYVTFLDDDGERDLREEPQVEFGPGARLGDILIARGLLTQSQIDEAIKLQDRLGKRMGQIVIDKGWVDEADVLRCLSEQLDVPFVRLRPGMFDPATAALLDRLSNAARPPRPPSLCR